MSFSKCVSEYRVFGNYFKEYRGKSSEDPRAECCLFPIASLVTDLLGPPISVFC